MATSRRDDGAVQAGVNGQDGINGDDLKQYLKRQGEDSPGRVYHY
jgi:hypothetical protein